MNGSYYGRLGVDQTADERQIKRAYYTLVKQYPPERFPEEYKELRAAYDVLSDAKKRAEYDRSRALPEDAAYLFEQGAKLERVGKHAQATEVYEKILGLHPGLTQAKSALARAFERQGKNGKALSVWAQLCAAEPENAEYSYELALSYTHRGWHKKAAAQYRLALELDGGNADCWVALLDCLFESKSWDEAFEVCHQGMRAMEERSRECISLYSYAAILYMPKDTAAAERYLKDIVRVMRTGGDPDDIPEDTIRLLLDAAILQVNPAFIGYIQEMAATLLHVDGDLREALDEASRFAEIEALEEQGYDVVFHDLFATLCGGCDCEDCILERTAMECHILADPGRYRPQILRLREEYPNLYALHSSFFNEALIARDTQKLLSQRMKYLSKKGMSPAFAADAGDGEQPIPTLTVRRTDPKVGRNDPCPCGSGKKYKKCCGR